MLSDKDRPFLISIFHMNQTYLHLIASISTKLLRGLFSPKSYVDVLARRQKSDFLYTNFLPKFPPISIPFSFRKKITQFWPNLVLFTIDCPKYTKLGPLRLWWKHPNRYSKFREKAHQKAGTYKYTMSMWEPPPPRQLPSWVSKRHYLTENSKTTSFRKPSIKYTIKINVKL